MKKNIHPDEALQLVLEDQGEAACESLDLDRALGRVLASRMPALVDQPPFDKSAMDGYACAEENSSGCWTLQETIPAGSRTAARLVPGRCSSIMTGAIIPQGTQFVLRKEYAEEKDGIVRAIRPEQGSNIIKQGENQKKGDVLLTPRRLEAQDIGILASSGYAKIDCVVPPKLGILSTGDELRCSKEQLEPGCIYDSNGPGLTAQAKALGCRTEFFGIVADRPDLLKKAFSHALENCDVLIISGAVSMGDFDHVPKSLEQIGVNCVYHGLQMKPGKPSYYGRRGQQSVFGLPGNPVSTFVNFEVLVKPHILKRMGIYREDKRLCLSLSTAIKRKTADRLEFLPACCEGKTVRPLQYTGSSMLSALAEADALITMNIGTDYLAEGDLVDVRLIRT